MTTPETKKQFLQRTRKKVPFRDLTSEGRKRITQQIENLIKDRKIPENSGLFLSKDDEVMPVYGPVSFAERVIARRERGGKLSGARIVLTKDNYGHRGTGLGGLGGTMCEAIDLVAGSLTCEKEIHTDSTRTRANFITDGARIYLTERGDIQNYFALGPGDGATSISSELKSGIGMKADHTLVLGRERVRILVGLSAAEGGERLANLNEHPTGRIDIGAVLGRDGDFEKAVLGDSLVKYLDKINDRINNVAQYCQKLEDRILAVRIDMASHFHTGGGIGYIQTVPDPVLISKGMGHVGKYLSSTTEKIMDQINYYIEDAASTGIEGGVVNGAKDAGILSTVVYIGKGVQK
tara:strand:+ start:8967 stop:10016 length:1050 start_codon:yes stop_codon:yes gene_type:complete